MLSIDALTFTSAREALEQGAAPIPPRETGVDLGGVKAADSSGVALLLAWQRRALDAGHRVTFVNVPDNVHKLAALYGVDALLPQQA